MLEELKEYVYKANLRLFSEHLVTLTCGNVSAIDPNSKFVVIKPSGVEYSSLSPKNMVIVDLNGRVIEGKLKPSCDTPTHIELYKKFPQLKAITHTHSPYACAFAQAGKDIIPLGTTHADYANGNILCTRQLTEEEVEKDYETNTALVIAEKIREVDDYINKYPGILVRGHGPFTWGNTPKDSVDNAIALESIAQMALLSKLLDEDTKRLPEYLLRKHYERKHGKTAYYGQVIGKD